MEFDISTIAENEPPTVEQLDALFGIAYRYRADKVKAGQGGGGLSPTYLGFSLYRHIPYSHECRAHDEHLVSGGIDQEGRVST